MGPGHDDVYFEVEVDHRFNGRKPLSRSLGCFGRWLIRAFQHTNLDLDCDRSCRIDRIVFLGSRSHVRRERVSGATQALGWRCQTLPESCVTEVRPLARISIAPRRSSYGRP